MQITENFSEFFSFECQYAMIIRGIWNGILTNDWVLDIPSISLGMSETYR